ncbi:MAG: DUF3501 family protein [Alphaproteobacteria bacterium]
MAKQTITADDVMALDDYLAVRRERRSAMAEVKRKRRLAVGPDMTFYFESRETILHQIHEMLAIEKGGPEQLADELDAYGPLVPQGRDLVATVMVEIPDEARRRATLATLGGFEETLTLTFAGHTVRAEAEQDVDRTTAEGKASSVQFVHFPMSDEQARQFRQPGCEVVVAVNHPAYRHMMIMPEEMRRVLAEDLAA